MSDWSDFPNVGKSTLLSRVTNATPKIANYHFTTLSPNLGVVDLEGGGFVIADIPGLIEGASEGVGLGLEFLRHIERTKVIIHMVDAASVEGRDPVDDIRKDQPGAGTVMIRSAGETGSGHREPIKMDIRTADDGRGSAAAPARDALSAEQGIEVFPISAVERPGPARKTSALMPGAVLHESSAEETTAVRAGVPIRKLHLKADNLPFTVEKSEEEADTYIVEGPRIEKMLGYTNLESEKGFQFFQNFLKDNGILEKLEELGVRRHDPDVWTAV